MTDSAADGWGRANPPLSPPLAALLSEDWPRFSPHEMARRRAAIDAAMADAGADYCLVYGSNRTGTAISWLTHWPTTAEAALVLSEDVPDALYVQYHNHVPQASVGATGCEVFWGGADTIATVIAELQRRGAGTRHRIGVIGPLAFGPAGRLRAAFPNLVDLNRAYTGLRLIKSAEEIERMRIGAWLSDAGIAAAVAAAVPGVTERAFCDACERAWVPLGGETVIHFVASTAMAAPDCRVPRQVASARPLARGDAVFCEISAAFHGYSGQVLRTFTVEAPPTPLYRDLHAAADAAFDAIRGVLRPGAAMADLVAAASVIEQAGFTTCDDLVHGYGGGYLPPILGSASRPAGPLPDLELQAGMCLVVQPNVTTRDGMAGVQTGECLLLTESGSERLHAFPRGLGRVG